MSLTCAAPEVTYELVLPPLYEKQRAAIYDPHRFSLIEAGTKTGKTLGCAIWLGEKSWTAPLGSMLWWIAPVYKQARIGYRRLKSLFPRDLVECKDSELEIRLPGDRIIQCRSGQEPDNLYGEAVFAAVVDEASRLSEKSFWALRSTLTQTRGPVRIIGNPKGKKNWFYLWGQKARIGADESAAYHHLRTADCPFIDREEIELARQLLPPHVFKELYEGEAQDDETGVFRGYRECVADCLEEPRLGVAYYSGIDLARLQDYTVNFVGQTIGDVLYVRHMDRFNILDWPVQRARLKATNARYHKAEALVDTSGVGDSVFAEMRKDGMQVTGMRTAVHKERIIEELMLAFENRTIRIPNDDVLLSELDLFEYRLSKTGRVTYSAPEGFLDDTVVALALLNWKARRSSWTEGGWS